MAARLFLQCLEMRQKRMRVRKFDFVGDFQGNGAVHVRLEFGAVFFRLRQLDAQQFEQEIQMPPCAAELAVGYVGQADRFFFGNQCGDFPVFDAVHLFKAAFAAGAEAARLLQGVGTQEAADDVETVRGAGAHNGIGKEFAHDVPLIRKQKSYRVKYSRKQNGQAV